MDTIFNFIGENISMIYLVILMVFVEKKIKVIGG